MKIAVVVTLGTRAKLTLVKNLNKISSLAVLFIMFLALSAAPPVHAVGVIGTVTVGVDPGSVAYDSGKGEIFVANAPTLSPRCN